MPRLSLRALVLVLLILVAVLTYISFNINPTDSQGAVRNPPTILLVSAFFPLSTSKHSMSDYKEWLTHFLQPITTHIYFFTTPEFEPFIRSLRGPNLPITINTTFSSPFDIPPLKDGIGTKEKYEEMWAWDREKDIRNPELYAVWTAKPYFLEEGLRNSGIAYDLAFWTDAGSFRSSHSYKSWPDPIRVKEVWDEGSKGSGMSPEDLLFFPMWGSPHSSMKFWSEDIGPVNGDNAFSEGSFFGGSAHTIKWWRSLFFKYHDHWLSHGLFVGEDQVIFDVLFLLNPRRIIGVWQYDPSAPPPPPHTPHPSSALSQAPEWGDSNTPHGACGSTWFYYQFFLASESERENMRGRWGSGSVACRLGRVIVMEPFLKSIFGNDWVAPLSSLSESA